MRWKCPTREPSFHVKPDAYERLAILIALVIAAAAVAIYAIPSRDPSPMSGRNSALGLLVPSTGH